jgi:cysteine-rich repeat protein
MVFTYKCDDGNNIDGDGCSSTCQNEKNYKCVGSKTTPSHCRFIGFVSLKVTSVDKVVDENKIMITITTSPTINNLQLMNITNLYNFNSSGDCSLVSITVVGPSIQLLVHYNSDLVGSSANF